MKNFKLIICTLLLSCAFLSCSKDEPIQTGSLEVSISYFFNDFQGYRSDVGATAYLYKQVGKSIDYSKSSPRVGIVIFKDGTEAERMFSADANSTGLAKFDNIPYGDYLLIVRSKGRFSFSVKPITINSSNKTEVKNFGYRHEFEENGEPW